MSWQTLGLQYQTRGDRNRVWGNDGIECCVEFSVQRFGFIVIATDWGGGQERWLHILDSPHSQWTVHLARWVRLWRGNVSKGCLSGLFARRLVVELSCLNSSSLLDVGKAYVETIGNVFLRAFPMWKETSFCYRKKKKCWPLFFNLLRYLAQNF